MEIDIHSHLKSVQACTQATDGEQQPGYSKVSSEKHEKLFTNPADTVEVKSLASCNAADWNGFRCKAKLIVFAQPEAWRSAACFAIRLPPFSKAYLGTLLQGIQLRCHVVDTASQTGKWFTVLLDLLTSKQLMKLA